MKEYKYKINGNEYSVAIIDLEGDKAAVEVNGVSYQVDILTEGYTAPAPRPAAKPAAAPAPAPAAAPAAKGAAGEGTPIAAPLPGVVTKVLVAAGQAVKKGDTVVVLEAMKMENNITAECDGKITGICVAAGDSVLEGTTLVTIG